MTFEDYNYNIYNPYILVEDVEELDPVSNFLEDSKLKSYVTETNMRKESFDNYKYEELAVIDGRKLRKNSSGLPLFD